MPQQKSAPYLVDRLKEILTEGKWVTGTNFYHEIKDVDWKDARKKVNDLNSIAALTFHINYYLEGVAKVFKGGELTIRDKYSFDHPDLKSETEWQNFINTIWTEAKEFITLIEKLDDSILDTFLAEKNMEHTTET